MWLDFRFGDHPLQSHPDLLG
ncbi:hypothetical protein CBM2600_B40009 [Cupriavidus taiwanensis]|nr:hypothetical protein CBM2600_B40009 [Cupriavidus taiwanensis]